MGEKCRLVELERPAVFVGAQGGEEDKAGEVGECVDTAKLLEPHEQDSARECSTVAGHAEEFDEAVAPVGGFFFAFDLVVD